MTKTLCFGGKQINSGFPEENRDKFEGKQQVVLAEGAKTKVVEKVGGREGHSHLPSQHLIRTNSKTPPVNCIAITFGSRMDYLRCLRVLKRIGKKGGRGGGGGREEEKWVDLRSQYHTVKTDPYMALFL